MAIQQLSKHSVFTGKYLSVGERSMLAVFQEVAKTIKDYEVGQMATFDLMYDGIAGSIRGDMQTSIKLAERQLGDGLPIRILKALFLLKWVPEFKATARNVAILLINKPDIDIRSHEKEVREALALLEAQSYLQRNGEVYEFLTDAEKDIEVEIKNTDIDESKVVKLLSETLFADVLKDPKIRYENGQDYTYGRKLDDEIIGKDSEVAINIITTENLDHANSNALAMRNVGKAELLTILPADTRLTDNARLYLKTQTYVQQNTGGGDETRKAILDQRTQQNSLRLREMLGIATEYLTKSPIYLNGNRLESVGEGDPRNRFARASQELISFAYPNLRMLKGSYDETTLSKALLDQDDLLTSGTQTLSEAEQEILTYVMRNQNNGERTSVEEIVNHFSRRPYGWYPMAVLTLVARLFRMGRVELRTTELLDSRTAFEHLKNSRQRGNVRVRLQEQFDSGKINALKKFHHDFFDRANSGTEARSVGQFTSEALAAEARDLTLLLDQVPRYPFLELLRPIAERLTRLSEKDYSYLLTHLAEFENEFLTAKDDLLSPIKAFMHGPQRAAYDEAISFLREEEANFGELTITEVQPLRDLVSSTHPFRGNTVPSAKVAVTLLRERLIESLKEERDVALTALGEKETKLRETEDFKKLDELSQQQVLKQTLAAREAVGSARFVTGIRDRLRRYITQEYPEQLALSARLGANAGKGPGSTDEDAQIKATSIRYTTAASLKPTCDLPYISNEAELGQWLSALRIAAQAELDKGNRISL
jgi:hypothetical protein